MIFFGKDNSGSFQTAVCPKLYQKNCVTKVTTVQHRHSGKVRFRDRIEAFVLNVLKIGGPFHILKAETVDDGRKGAERYVLHCRTDKQVQEAFPAEPQFQDAHRFP